MDLGFALYVQYTMFNTKITLKVNMHVESELLTNTINNQDYDHIFLW